MRSVGHQTPGKDELVLFESLGFKVEALLREHVRNVDDNKHDIVVLGHNIAQVPAQMEGRRQPVAYDKYDLAGSDE